MAITRITSKSELFYKLYQILPLQVALQRCNQWDPQYTVLMSLEDMISARRERWPCSAI